MSRKLSKKEKRTIRHKRVRAKIVGTAKRPRLAVFRSNKHVWAQLIDDNEGKTLTAAGDKELKGKKENKGEAVGALLAKRAGEKKIAMAVFDRGGYQYHGLIRGVAEGARKGGLRL